ncbi:hypothetical protein Mmc1_0180 [Magnetococcus marinus MC-1]|uniref:MotA/TolQ/ExbB proton channel domain-containing protein n=1 Tax=Magnetococcus marinus (strain ATCC BAA-1437 / JCM 17883 / MC-1) TaxID=156889 RepID=A0L414_MAGMM|nr:hypothetical protein [Magnetococcus marinus]ABK42707.1 hypothetical protein Mmc1_0180 [Magnetococcus marinus MC-1]
MALPAPLQQGSAALSYLLGGVALALALATLATSLQVTDIIAWLKQVFGVTFLVLMSILLVIALTAWIHVWRSAATPESDGVWLESGMQAANGVTTLALTYTLLGISLGIGSLADQALTPETVQSIVGELTAHFSLAFMTTVVGLPLSAVLRAMLMVSHAHNVACWQHLAVMSQPQPLTAILMDADEEEKHHEIPAV